MPHNYNAPRHSNDNPIAIARISKGLTQAQLAQAIGVDKRQISAWELGRFTPSASVIKQIATILDVDWVSLIDSQPEKKHYSPIVNARKEKGWTQGQLATAIGVSQGLISNYETGASRVPDKILKQIADVLGVPPETFAEVEKWPK